mmetsp:Transcript_21061/g.60381  ORF Transcript_21061/g.60381 Transcript_21061/m.60381 type:complete len:275 (+) Transcript_21061:177-1001(+)
MCTCVQKFLMILLGLLLELLGQIGKCLRCRFQFGGLIAQVFQPLSSLLQCRPVIRKRPSFGLEQSSLCTCDGIPFCVGKTAIVGMLSVPHLGTKPRRLLPHCVAIWSIRRCRRGFAVINVLLFLLHHRILRFVSPTRTRRKGDGVAPTLRCGKVEQRIDQPMHLAVRLALGVHGGIGQGSATSSSSAAAAVLLALIIWIAGSFGIANTTDARNADGTAFQCLQILLGLDHFLLQCDQLGLVADLFVAVIGMSSQFGLVRSLGKSASNEQLPSIG